MSCDPFHFTISSRSGATAVSQVVSLLAFMPSVSLNMASQKLRASCIISSENPSPGMHICDGLRQPSCAYLRNTAGIISA